MKFVLQQWHIINSQCVSNTKHLLQCLVNGKMTEFPGRKRKPRTKKSAIIPVHVFCKCRQPECGEMAECDQCHEWFHKKCESIPDMVWLQLKSNMVLRAVNAVLTRTLHAFVRWLEFIPSSFIHDVLFPFIDIERFYSFNCFNVHIHYIISMQFA